MKTLKMSAIIRRPLSLLGDIATRIAPRIATGIAPRIACVALCATVAMIAAPKAVAQVSSVPVCLRTPEVQRAILDAITAENPGETFGCIDLVDSNLSDVATLDLSNQGIRELRPGDFSGLHAMTTLDLRGNPFTLLNGALSGIAQNVDTLQNPDGSPRNPNGALRNLYLPRLGLEPTGLKVEVQYPLRLVFIDPLTPQRINAPEIHLNWNRPGSGFAPGHDRDNPDRILPSTSVSGYKVEVSTDGVNYTELTADTSTLRASVPGENYAPTPNSFVHRKDLELDGFVAPATRLSYRISANINTNPRGTPDLGVGPPAVVSHTVRGVDSDVCSRTAAVRNEIVRIAAVDRCGDVKTYHLAAILDMDLERKLISSLRTGDFAGLLSLEDINLSNNSLTSLPRGVFDGLNTLESIDLSDNRISSLPTGVFGGLRELSELFLNNNALRELPLNLFAGNQNLHTLTLTDNRLTDLPKEIYAHLPALSRLAVDPMPVRGLVAVVDNYPTNLSRFYFTELKGAPEVALLWESPFSSDGDGLFPDINIVGYKIEESRDGNSWRTVTENTGPVACPTTVDQVGNTQVCPGTTRVWRQTRAMQDPPLQFSEIRHYRVSPLFQTTSNPNRQTHPQLPDGSPAFPANPPAAPQIVVGPSNTVGVSAPTLPPAPAVSSICSRTEQVRDAIVAAVGAQSCSGVSRDQLSSIRSIEINGVRVQGAAQTRRLVDAYSGPTLHDNYNPIYQYPVLGGGVSREQILTNPPRYPQDYANLPTARDYDVPVNAPPREADQSSPLNALRPNDFSGMHNLHTLTLSGNALTTLPEGVFRDLVQLTSLNLADNDLTSVPATLLRNTPLLQTLNLSFNELASVPAGLFDGLSQMTKLFINNNPFTAFPRSLLAQTPFGDPDRTNLVLSIDRMAPDNLRVVANEAANQFMITWQPPFIATANSEIQDAVASVIDTFDVEFAVNSLADDEFATITSSPVFYIGDGVSPLTANFAPGGGIVADASYAFRVRANIMHTPFTAPDTAGTPVSAPSAWAQSTSVVRDTSSNVSNICQRSNAVRNAITAAVSTERGETIVCSEVTTGDVDGIFVLDLSGLGLTRLLPGDFADMTNLIALDLSNNDLRDLPADLFSLPLISLNLGLNPQLSVPAEMFDRLINLRTLVFDPMTMSPTNLAGELRGFDNGENYAELTLTWERPFTGIGDAQPRIVGYRIQSSADGAVYRDLVENTGSNRLNHVYVGPRDVAAGPPIAGDAHRGGSASPSGPFYRVAALFAAGDSVQIGNFSSPIEARQAIDGTALNQAILPEIARAIMGTAGRAITERIGAANAAAKLGIGQSQYVGNFNLGGQTTLAGMLNAHGEAVAHGDDMKYLLADSDFSLQLNAADGTGLFGGGHDLTLWGGAEYRDMSGAAPDISWSGNLTGYHLGVDTARANGGLRGIALSKVIADLDYNNAIPNQADSGTGQYEIDITSLHPYLGWRAGSLDWWATFGYGDGTLTIKPDAEDGIAANSGVRMTAVGVGAGGDWFATENVDVRLKGEVSTAEIKIEEGRQIDTNNVRAQRVRFGVELGGKQQQSANGGIYDRSLEFGGRYDGGDGEQGGGMELGGGIRYYNAAKRMTAEGSARLLFGHVRDYEEWGVQGSVRVDPGADGQGLSFQVSPGYGDNSARIQQLWREGLSADETDRSDEYSAHLDASLGYGLSLRASDGVITPYSEMSLGTTDTYRMGLRWRTMSSFDWNLLGEQRDAGGDAENALWLKGQMRF